MGLRLKFNLILILITIVGLAISGFASNKLLQNNAREEVLNMARMMMESAVAVRSYTVSEVRPLMKVQQRRAFIPQTVPAYAASKYIKKLQETHPEYSYKEATLNPTNPADKATEWETDVVDWFRANKDEQELVGERMSPTGPQLYFGRPITIKNPNCLACHSTPAAAPQTLIDSYGSSNGFGWKLNETVGAQIVSVPMELSLDRAANTFQTFMLTLVGIFLAVAVVLNLMLHYIVIKPVRIMSEAADKISLGDLDVEEIKISGSDEIGLLGRSFNRMHRSLSNAVQLLDETDD
ncbi:MAG: HAMP domain-containing protein [Oceanicoccus sp.]|jgi:HAMP domain-containing protein